MGVYHWGCMCRDVSVGCSLMLGILNGAIVVDYIELTLGGKK